MIDASKELVIRLRLESDKGNGAVSSRITQEVQGAADKAYKAFASNGQKHAKDVEDFSRKMVAGMSGAADKTVAANERANQRIKAGFASLSAEAKKQADRDAAVAKKSADEKIAADNRVMQNRIKMVDQVAQFEKRQQAESEANQRKLLQMQVRQDRALHRGFSGAGRIAGGLGGMARGGFLLGSESEDIQKLAQSYIKIEAVFSIFQGGLQTLLAINREMTVYRQSLAAAAVEAKILGTATSAAGAPGIGGAGAATGGVAAVAGGSASGALGTAGAIGATAVAVAGAGLALHEGIVTAINKTGFFSTRLDTVSGTLSEWNDAVRASTRLQERMDINIAARAANEAERKDMGEKTKAYYAGRQRIEDAQKGYLDLAGDQTRLKAAEGMRSNWQSMPLTKGGQIAGKRFDVEMDRYREQKEFSDRYASLRAKAIASENSVSEIVAHNNKPRDQILMPGAVFGDVAQTQKNIDANEDKYHPGGNAYQRFTDATIGRAAAWWTGKGTAGLNAMKAARDRGNPTQPYMEPAPRDLNEQLARQEETLKDGSEVLNVTKERKDLLGQQLGLMKEQTVASREQVMAAKEQLKVAEQAANANMAHLATMTRGKQVTTANILHKMNAGQQVTRKDALFLKEAGVTQGAIGHKANAAIAATIDPRLAKEFDQAGGNEDVTKAQKYLDEATKAMAQAAKDEKESADKFKEAVELFRYWTNIAVDDRKAVEKTQSQVDKHKDSNEASGAAGEQVAAVEKAGKQFVAAIQELNDATVAQIQAAKDAVSTSAQRIRAMHS